MFYVYLYVYIKIYYRNCFIVCHLQAGESKNPVLYIQLESKGLRI